MSEPEASHDLSVKDSHQQIVRATKSVVNAYERLLEDPEADRIHYSREEAQRGFAAHKPLPTGTPTELFQQEQAQLYKILQQQAEANPSQFLRTTAALLDAHAAGIELGDNPHAQGPPRFLKQRLGFAARKTRRIASGLADGAPSGEPLPTEPLHLAPRPTEDGETLLENEPGYKRGVEFLDRLPAYHLVVAANMLASNPDTAEAWEAFREHVNQPVVDACAAALANDEAPKLNPVLQQLSMGVSPSDKHTGRDFANAIEHRIGQKRKPLEKPETPRPSLLPGAKRMRVG